MVLTSSIISIAAFDNDVSAPGQQIAKVIKELGAENGVSQESEVNLALYCSFFSQRTVPISQEPPNDMFAGCDFSS